MHFFSFSLIFIEDGNFFPDGGAGAGDARFGEWSAGAKSKTLLNINTFCLHG